jgi:hypothetical protein
VTKQEGDASAKIAALAIGADSESESQLPSGRQHTQSHRILSKVLRRNIMTRTDGPHLWQ